MKDKIQVAFKDKDLTCSHLLRNLFFMDRLKAIVMELVLSIPKLFFFFCLFIYFALLKNQVLQVHLLFKYFSFKGVAVA